MAKSNLQPLYNKMILNTSLSISPADLNKNISENLERRLKNNVEGVCMREGYIRPGSAHILFRSLGNMEHVNFTGNTTYTIKYEAEVCNPQKGQIIECEVASNNKSQVDAFVQDVDTTPLNISIPRSRNLNNTDFISLVEGDIIRISVIDTLYGCGDKTIVVLGEYLETL